MKIGIVTPYDSANCGAYLQAYANNVFWKRITIMCVLYSGEMKSSEKRNIFLNPRP